MNEIQIQNLTQSFRSGFWLKKKQILHSISFRQPKGRTLGVIGPNGAGKTTLIHCLTGIRRPESGQITVFGNTVDSIAYKQNLGYLPERPLLLEFMTGSETLRYFGELNHFSGSKLKARVHQVLNKVGILHAANIKISAYSKGMQQRLGIAQAILHDPELLILDEPMSGLDPVGRREIRELIAELAKDGKTIVFSSHILSDVEEICDDLVAIKKGELTYSGPMSALFEKAIEGYRITTDQLKLEIKNLEEAQKKIQELQNSNHKILEFIPIRKSMEALFFT